MDPVTAVGLAAGILQFVEFTTSVVLNSIELGSAASGQLADHSNIEETASRLVELSEPLASVSTSTPLGIIAQACCKDGKELREILAKHKSGSGTRSRVTVAVKSTWNQKKIDKMRNRLEGCRNEMHTHMLAHERIKIAEVAQALNEVRVNSANVKEENTANHKTLLSAIEVLSKEKRKDQAQFQEFKAIDTVLEAFVTVARDPLEVKLKDVQQGMANLATKQDIVEWRNETKIGVDSIRQDMLRVNLKEEEQKATTISELQQQFLDDLYDVKLFSRERAVARNTTATFEWVYNGQERVHWYRTRHSNEQGDIKHTGLQEWLTSSHGVFWIIGKPGAGKSTLMKFIAKNPRTQEALKVWAGSSSLVIASAYFWISGDPLQRSLSGLLRSLLYQVLTERPELIQAIFPRQWRACHRSLLKHTWEEEELISAFTALKTLKGYKICCFVDGLDEYEGTISLEELCRFTLDLCDSQDIKVCASSRPWEEFKLCFGTGPVLSVDEWTREDMVLFIKQQLGEHKYWSDIVTLDPQRSTDILDTISMRSEGVFLWVFLVVRNLKDGMKKGDTALKLLEIIDQLPQDLNTYFGRMLKGLRPQDLKWTARALFICRHYDMTSQLMYYFADQDESDFAETISVPRLTRDQLHARANIVERLMSTCCKDLLVAKVTKGPYQSETLPRAFYAKVQFNHRTVRDFLDTSEDVPWLRAHALTKEQGAYWGLQACTAQINCFPLVQPDLNISVRHLLRDEVPVWLHSTCNHREAVRSINALNQAFQALPDGNNLFPIEQLDHFLPSFMYVYALYGGIEWLAFTMDAPQFRMTVEDLEALLRIRLGIVERFQLADFHVSAARLVSEAAFVSLTRRVSRKLFEQGHNPAYLDLNYEYGVIPAIRSEPLQRLDVWHVGKGNTRTFVTSCVESLEVPELAQMALYNTGE